MKKAIKKELKQKLTADAMIHLGNLKKSRQKKLDKYLGRSMNSIADYYLNLLSKKQLKKITQATPPLENSTSQPLVTAATNTILS
ncbi:hypothetical protein [Ferruginibacter sp.]